MKPTLSLTIPQTCHEQWKSFTPTTTGGYCASCCKNVIDFTHMSDQDVLDFFQQATGSTCGRFRADQLKSYYVESTSDIRPGLLLLRAGLVSLALALVGSRALAQHPQPVKPATEIRQPSTKADTDSDVTYMVKGYVEFDDGSKAAGVNVILQGEPVGTVTDANGYFEFPQRLHKGDVLLFSFIGFETVVYPVKPGNDALVTIELKLMMEMQVFMGEVAIDRPYTQTPPRVSIPRRFWRAVKSIFA